MDLLKNVKLVKADKGEIEIEEALKDKDIVAFYFSAHWCPPCCEFTPILAKAYTEAKSQNLPIEVIFVTNDGSEEDMLSYMREMHGDWLALPYGCETINQLDAKFEINGIPTLVVLKKDGTTVTEDGRAAVETKGVKAFQDWLQ